MQETTQQHANPAKISRRASQVASKWELGELRVNFMPRLSDWRSQHYSWDTLRDLGNMIIGMITVLVFLFYGVLSSDIVNDFFEIIVGVLGALMFIMNAVSLVRLVWHVSAWERGLVVKKVWRNWQVIYWDEIEAYWCLARSPYCKLHLKDGSELRLDRGVFNVQALTSEVEEQVKKRLLSKALADFEAGKTLTFDLLSLNKEGLSLSGETISWYRIREVDTQTIKGAVLISTATGSNAPAVPLDSKETFQMLRQMGKKKERAVACTSDHVLLTSQLPNFSIVCALIEHASSIKE